MSLLDKATIITAPTAHSNGKLHSIKGGAVADFDVVRGSAATRVNAEGLIEDISLLSGELVTNGYFATDSWWTLGQFWSIANGFATRAVVGSELNYSVSRSNLLTIGKSYKVEIDVNSVDSGSVKLVLGSTNSTEYTSDGVYVFEGVCTSSTSFKISPSNDFNGSIDSISVKEVIDATNIPRIDYTTGEGVILTEPQSTNLVTYSEEFSNASWAKVSTAVVDDASTSPDGTINASSIELASGGYMYFTHSATINIGDKWTWSCFVKSSDQKITWGGGTPDGTDVYSIETLSNGWYRHILQRTFIASGINVQLMFSEAIAGADLFYVYGAQLEALPYATSYIPTSGAIATRLADAITGAGDSSTINSTEGVLYADMAALVEVDNARRFITLNDGSASNGVVLRYEATGIINARYQIGGVAQCSISFTTTITNAHKVAFKYKENDFSLWIDGVEVGVDNVGSVLGVNTINNMSFDHGGGAFPFYGKTKAIAVFSEALTDAELTCLTTI